MVPPPPVTPPGSLPQQWLPPGPYLPRRTWQQKTRTAVSWVTGVSGGVWILALIAVVLVGYLVGRYQKTATFTGGGGVIVDCSSATTADGEVEAGTLVVAWTDRTDRVLRTRLEKVKQTEVRNTDDASRRTVTRCYLPFSFDKLRRDAAGYNIRIGNTDSQFVTSKSLAEGAIVPIVVGGEK